MPQNKTPHILIKVEPLPVLIRHIFGYFVKNGPQVCLRIIFLIPITPVCKSEHPRKNYSLEQKEASYVTYIGSAMPFFKTYLFQTKP